jgi:glycosyltransferase involved in cell wall biosynthesis
MRILQLVHGYPPRETAGTEQHTRQLAVALAARGHDVHVLAATRAPGRAQYSVLEEPGPPGAPGVTRLVNNIPTRSLWNAERDAAVDRAVDRVVTRFQPDLVHIQHLQFLSCSVRFDAPVVATLHDAWAWCAAGGTLLQPDRSPCPGPTPDRCAPCASGWRPVPGRAASALIGAAGVLAPVLDPDRLHRLYQRVPARLRARVHRDRADVDPPAAAARRNAAMQVFYANLAGRIAPSRFLADAAEAAGLGDVQLVRHGAAGRSRPRTGGGPLLFLGGIAWHKGPDLVVDGWRRAFPDGGPGLDLHGPMLEPELVRGHPVGDTLDRAGVAHALSRATALVMGSRWPENAPLVLLEARAAGCPVVAPAIGGVPELVEDGVDGLLYAPGDPDDLARALRAVAHGRFEPRPPRTLAMQVDDTLAAYARAGAP